MPSRATHTASPQKTHQNPISRSSPAVDVEASFSSPSSSSVAPRLSCMSCGVMHSLGEAFGLIGLVLDVTISNARTLIRSIHVKMIGRPGPWSVQACSSSARIRSAVSPLIHVAATRVTGCTALGYVVGRTQCSTTGGTWRTTHVAAVDASADVSCSRDTVNDSRLWGRSGSMRICSSILAVGSDPYRPDGSIRDSDESGST